MGTTHKICFNDEKKKNTKIEKIRLLNEDNNNIIKKSKTNKINISIRKSYKKNNSNTFNQNYNIYTHITDVNKENKIKNSKKENKKEDYIINNEYNCIKNYKILTIKKRNKRTHLPDLNLYNENVFSNIKYKKGELKDKKSFSEI